MATPPTEAHYEARLGCRGTRGGRRGMDMESESQRVVSTVDIVGMSTPHGVMLWWLRAGDIPRIILVYPHHGPERKGLPLSPPDRWGKTLREVWNLLKVTEQINANGWIWHGLTVTFMLCPGSLFSLLFNSSLLPVLKPTEMDAWSWTLHHWKCHG